MSDRTGTDRTPTTARRRGASSRPGTPAASRMQAIVQPRYGAPADVLELREVDRPTPGDGEVLVRVRAAAVNAADWHLVTGEPTVMRLSGGLGLRRPQQTVAGRDVAGRVEAVGPGATRFAVGDEVFGFGRGTFAEHTCASQDELAHRPAGIGAVEAAAVPLAGSTALQALRDHGRLRPGQRVLITGASGGVGTLAVQIAVALGAHVTAVCSTRNTAMVAGLGAHRVVDYTREDVLGGGERYDLIVDLAGRPSLWGCRRSLTSAGTLLTLSGDGGRWFGPLPRMIRALALFAIGRRTVRIFTVREDRDDLLALAELLQGRQLAPVLDRCQPLAEAPEAVEHVRQGHTRGKVVLTVAGDGPDEAYSTPA